MPEIKNITVTIRSRNNHELPPAQGKIKEAHWSKADRTQNALKTLGLGLGLTFGSALVPIAHYFLVPSIFIATLVLSLQKTKESVSLLGGEGNCPKCKKSFVIEKSQYQTRFTDVCSECRDDLEILLPNPV